MNVFVTWDIGRNKIIAILDNIYLRSRQPIERTNVNCGLGISLMRILASTLFDIGAGYEQIDSFIQNDNSTTIAYRVILIKY